MELSQTSDSAYCRACERPILWRMRGGRPMMLNVNDGSIHRCPATRTYRKRLGRAMQAGRDLDEAFERAIAAD